MVLNLDNILQQTNNSAPDNTITMPPSTFTSRFKVTSTEMELNAISEARSEKTTIKQTGFPKLYQGTKIKLLKHRLVSY